MNRPVFEIRRTDGAGRLGQLTVPRAEMEVTTPALLPVVNPRHQQISPAQLAEEFDIELLITNAYVLHGSDEFREPALERGLHDWLDFPGAIMTDSGSFQLAEYGSIDVDTEEILRFQDAIGSDIATPVDVPTPPDSTIQRAESDLKTTLEAIEESAAFDSKEMLLTAPIQGSTHPSLRERAAREAATHELDIYPVGAMVPLLREYRYEEVARIVAAAKRGLPHDAPVHLFGAGHPMMFAFGVAMGCDLFDSAAYALYARKDRYLTVSGTTPLERLDHFPCRCEMCREWTPADLRSAPDQLREEQLARHNLHVSVEEMMRIRQAISAGELLELVDRRARSHPRLLDGYRTLLSERDLLESRDAATRRRPMFYVSGECANRPEVLRHRQRIDRLDPPDRLTLVDPSIIPEEHAPDPWDQTRIRCPDVSIEETAWYAIPPFGPIPPALMETYPLAAELPRQRDVQGYLAACDTIDRLAGSVSDSLTIVHDEWPSVALDRLDETVTTVSVTPSGGEA